MKTIILLIYRKQKCIIFLIEKGDSIIIEKEEKLSPKTNIKTKQ